MDNIVLVDTCAFIHIICINCFYLFDNLKYSCLITKFIQLEIDSGEKTTRNTFYHFLKEGKISIIPLQIEDLIEMASYPEKRRVSDSELSCFILTKRHGYKTMTDDEPAIKFAISDLCLDPEKIIRLFNILIEAYENNLINDAEIKGFQEKLKNDNFIFHTDILEEAAKRKLFLKKEYN